MFGVTNSIKTSSNVLIQLKIVPFNKEYVHSDVLN